MMCFFFIQGGVGDGEASSGGGACRQHKGYVKYSEWDLVAGHYERPKFPGQVNEVAGEGSP